MVQKNFKKLKHRSDLYRWATHVDESGSQTDKWKKIENLTLEEFEIALQSGWSIHDVDIQRWALEAAVKVDLPEFKASWTWDEKFKNTHSICSRKITKLVSKAKFLNPDGLREKGEAFVSQVKPLVEGFGQRNVFNADQSGFNKAMSSGRSNPPPPPALPSCFKLTASFLETKKKLFFYLFFIPIILGRTLSSKGIRKVEISVQSVNATSHSSTPHFLRWSTDWTAFNRPFRRKWRVRP